ncbi:24436_t:CDS:2, partial [Gigaspora margarita]
LHAITLDNAANNNTFVLQAALDQIKEDVDKIRKLNSSIHTPQRLDLLKNACSACCIKFYKPILDCPTHWSSTYDMIKNGLFLKLALNTLTTSYDNLNNYAISRNQWATLDRVAKFLEPFKELTTKMSSSANITAFWIIPLFNIIFDHIEDTALAEEIENFDDDDKNFDELECYISKKPANKDIDFPHLACMANDYLAIPAFSAASERAFSAGENMITNKRSSLVPKTIKIAECLCLWTQEPLKGKLENFE